MRDIRPRFRIEPRAEVPAWMSAVAPPLSVLATILVSGLLFAVMGYPAGQTMYAFFLEPLVSVSGFSELLVKAAPLIIMAVGLAACYRANVWNIGAEGQLIMGAVAGGGVGLAFWHQAGWWILPLMCIAGILGGMAWAAIPALLRTRFNTSEVLTSLMLTYVASLLLTTLVFGPWKDPEGFNYPQSRLFNDSETLPLIVPGTRISLGTLLCFLVPFAGWVAMGRALVGFEIRTLGAAPAAARYAGFSQKRTVWLVMLLSGGLAGLAGLFEVSGPIGQLIPQLTPGYGFTAIIVAFLGRLNPLGIIPAGLLIALSYNGGDGAQIAVGLPKGASGLVQGMLLFFPLASEFLVRYRLRPVHRVADAPSSMPPASPAPLVAEA